MSGSKLAVGSSRNKNFGLLIRDLAKETLFFCPDESSPVLLFKNLFKSRFLVISLILFVKSWTPYNLPYTSKFSLL